MLTIDSFEVENMWHLLKTTDKPIVMYGTGDGAEKILHTFSEHSIKIEDIFVSDDFYRGKEFCGYKTYKYSDLLNKYGDFIIVLAFAVFRDDMISYVKELMKKHKVIAPYVPVFGDVYFDEKLLSDNKETIKDAYNCLYDELSRDTFKAILKYRISGDPSYLFNCETDRNDIFKEIIKLGDNEDFVDLGAYRGDTIGEFITMTNGHFSSILAFEPDTKNYNKCIDFVNSLPETYSKKICVINRASWSKEEVLNFSGEGGRNSSLVPQKEKKLYRVFASDLDSVLSGASCSYIKMDVEGAEAETLIGMKNTINAFKPKLIVSAYHKTCDIFELPLQIKSLNSCYRIYLRHHTYVPDWETNYYCI